MNRVILDQVWIECPDLGEKINTHLNIYYESSKGANGHWKKIFFNQAISAPISSGGPTNDIVGHHDRQKVGIHGNSYITNDATSDAIMIASANLSQPIPARMKSESSHDDGNRRGTS